MNAWTCPSIFFFVFGRFTEILGKFCLKKANIHKLKYLEFALNFLGEKNLRPVKILFKFCSFQYEPKATLRISLALSVSTQIDFSTFVKITLKWSIDLFLKAGLWIRWKRNKVRTFSRRLWTSEYAQVFCFSEFGLFA